MKKFVKTISRIIFWDFPRGTWQYDLFCILLILATIFIKPNFLIPKNNDKDKPTKTTTITMINKDFVSLPSKFINLNLINI